MSETPRYDQPGFATIAVLALMLAACSKQASPPDQATVSASASSVAASSVSAAAPMTLPISINAVMVGAIDHASDPLFGVGNAMFGSGKLPKTDADWREVQFHAYQMVILGKIIQMPGTGPRDVEWTSKPEWKAFADSLSTVGMDILALTEKKDAVGFQAAGNKLIDVCEGCHLAFKPDIPTMKLRHQTYQGESAK
jgi:hypothetical protein